MRSINRLGVFRVEERRLRSEYPTKQIVGSSLHPLLIGGRNSTRYCFSISGIRFVPEVGLVLFESHVDDEALSGLPDNRLSDEVLAGVSLQPGVDRFSGRYS